MYAVNVRSLKKNPSEALREAEKQPVLVLKGQKPNALIMHLDSSINDTTQMLKPAMASSLFKDEVLSLGAAAGLSGLSLSQFIEHLSQLDIDVVRADKATDKENDMLESWLS